uniref:Uncharacterized protein n=1 Tax=Schistocephalus solidus TaxID=70667 RepID=A0A0X3PS62_SCHSO
MCTHLASSPPLNIKVLAPHYELSAIVRKLGNPDSSGFLCATSSVVGGDCFLRIFACILFESAVSYTRADRALDSSAVCSSVIKCSRVVKSFSTAVSSAGSVSIDLTAHQFSRSKHVDSELR